MNTNLFSRLNQFFRNHPVWRWITAIVVTLFSSYAILVPLVAHWQIEKWMKENGEDRVKVERVTFNPFTMRLKVHSLYAEGVQNKKMVWKRMAFEFDVWQLHKRRIAIHDFVLEDAFITIGQSSGGNWVVGGIPVKTGTGKSKSGKEKKRWEIGVSNISLNNVQVRYRGHNIDSSGTINNDLFLQLGHGTISRISTERMSIMFGAARLENARIYTSTNKSSTDTTRPTSVKAGVFTLIGLSITGISRDMVIDSIAIQALDATIVRDKDGTFRIARLFQDKNKGSKPEQSESTPPKASIKSITIDGQSLAEFIDLSMKPPVTIQTTDLRFTLNDLYSSKDKAPGTYSLMTTIRPKATLNAKGKIGPLFPRPDMTVESEVDNFNLQQLSSYMVNLFGYEIDSGRVDGTIDGNVINDQLDINSKIKVNSLEISAVPEQSAYEIYKNAFVGMSLESALSVITDKNGDVNLSIPVKGNLSDPKFNFTDVLRAAIVNSISGGLNAVYNDSLR